LPALLRDKQIVEQCECERRRGSVDAGARELNRQIRFRAASASLVYAVAVTSEQPKKRHGWWLLGACLVVLLSLTLSPAWVEAGYCRGVFPWIQNAVVPVTGSVPWPLTLTVLLLLPIVWPLLAVIRWRRGRQRGVLRRTLGLFGVLRFLRVLLYTAAAFLLMWGIGYRRVPIEERWRLLDEQIEYEHVRDVGLRLLAIVRRDAPKEGEPIDEVAALAQIARQSRDLVTELEGWTPALPRHLKRPPAGLFIAVGIYGVCYPFTLEANVDAALPLPIRLAISGHELAHILGYCGEADANLVSFVAGLRADDPLARYSTALAMLRYAMNGPSISDNNWLNRNLPKRARDDLLALSDANRKHRVEVFSQAATKLNDTFLKAQGVELGVDDYERGFRLFVHAFHKGMVELPAPYPSMAEKMPEEGAQKKVLPAKK
jgi:hypothetical protein